MLQIQIFKMKANHPSTVIQCLFLKNKTKKKDQKLKPFKETFTYC